MSNDFKKFLQQAAEQEKEQTNDIEREVDYDEGITPLQKIKDAVNTAGETSRSQIDLEAMEQVEEAAPVFGKDFESIKEYLGEEGLNYETQDLEDMRAWSVSGTEKAGKFVARALGKAGTAIGEGAGIMMGLFDQSIEGTLGTMGLAEGEEGEFNMEGFVNNAVVKYFNELDKDIKDALPVYHRKAIEEGTLMDNLLSGEFWASEGADGVGFLLSALAPGAIIKGMKVGEGTGRALNALGQHHNWGKLVNVGNKLAQKGDLAAATAVNTIIEAGIEAGSTGRELEAYYANQVKLGNMTEQEATEAKAITMGKVFGANAALLILPNLIQNSTLFKAMSPDKGISPNLIKALRGETIEEAGKLAKAVDFLKPLGMNALSEGLMEEGGQFAIEKYFSRKAKGLDEDKSIIDTYLEGFTTMEGKKSMALGAILGGGMGGAQSIREASAKKQQDDALLKTFQENGETFETAIGNLLKKNPKTGEYITNKTGDVEMDPLFIIDQVAKAEESKKQLDMLTALSATNNREGEQFALNEIITKFVMPYAKVEGGLEILEDTVDSMVEGLGEKIGANSKVKAVLRQKILDRAESISEQADYMSIYGNDFFDLMPEDVDENTDFTKKVRDQFIQKLQDSGIHNENRQRHIKERIATLREEQSKLGDPEALSQGEKKVYDNLEKQIKTYEDNLVTLDEQAKLIFNKRQQRESFKNFLDIKIKERQEFEDFLNNMETEPESFDDKEATPEQLKYISDTFKDLVELENLTINNKEEKIIHSSEFAVRATDMDENEAKGVTKSKIEGEDMVPGENNWSVVGKSRNGNLQIKNNTTGKVGFINKDGSVFINKKRYEGFSYDVLTSKEFIKKERQGDAFLKVMEGQIEFLENEVKVFDRRVEANLKHIETVKKKIERAIANTKKLNGRKKKNLKEGRVKTIVAGKTMMLTAVQLEERLNKLETIIEDAKSKKENRLQRIDEIKSKRDNVLNDYIYRGKKEYLDLDVYEGFTQDMENLSNNYDLLIEKAEKELATGRNYINKLNSTLKGAYTSFKKMFDKAYPEYAGLLKQSDIEDKRIIVKTLQERKGYNDLDIKDLTDEDLMTMSEEDLDQVITDYHKANYDFDLMERDDFDLVALEDEDFDSMIYRDLAITKNLLEDPIFSRIYKNIEGVLRNLDLKNEQMEALEKELAEMKKAQEDLNKQIKNRQAYLDKFHKNYAQYVLDNNLVYSDTKTVDHDRKGGIENRAENQTTESTMEAAMQAETEVDSNIDPEGLSATKFTGGIESFFKSQSSQFAEQGKSTVKRWFSWLENYISAGEKKKDEYVATRFMAYSVHNLPEELHSKVTFFVLNDVNNPSAGGKNILRSAITEEQLPAAESDIKLLVYRKDKGEFVMKDNKPVYSSLPEANYERASGSQRFSFDYIRKSYENEEIAKIKDPTMLSEAEYKRAEEKAKEKANERLNKTKAEVLEEYKDIRQSIIEGEPMEFRSTGKNPGVKGATNGYVSPLGTIATTKKKLGKQIIRIAEKESEMYNGISYRTFPGQAYVQHQGRLVLLKPKTLGETGDIPRIIRIMQHLVKMPSTTNEQKAAKKEVQRYLRTMVHMNEHDNAFKFVFNNSYKTLNFGGKVINTQDLVDNNPDVITDLTNFLENKHHNISKDALSHKNPYYKMDVVNGVLKRQEAFTEGYNGYILSNTTSVELGPLGSTESPQFINTSLKLKPTTSTYISKKEKKAAEEASKKAGTTTTTKTETKLVGTEATTEQVVEAFNNGGTIGYDRTHKDGVETIIIKKLDDNVSLVDRLINNESNHDKLSQIDYLINKMGSEMEDGSTFGIEDVFSEAGRKALKMIKVYTYTETEVATTSETETKTETKSEGLTEAEIAHNAAKLANVLGVTGIGDLGSASKTEEKGDNSGAPKGAKVVSPYGPKGWDSIKNALLPTQSAEELNESIKWFKEKFPDIKIETVRDLIDNYSEGRLTKEGKVLISELSSLGTTYHEAFHVVSRMFLDKNQRAELYKEAQEITGKEMSEKEAEEYLAEEFRSFMLSDGKYNFPEKAKKKKNLFQKIWDFLKTFFSKEKAPISIEKVFRDIKNGAPYKGKGDLKGIPEDFDSRIMGLNYTQSAAIMKDFNSIFFGTMLTDRFGYNKVGPEALMEFEGNIREIYDYIKNEVLVEKVDGKLVARGDSFFPENDATRRIMHEFYYRNFDEIVDAHQKYLRQYQISIQEESKIEEDERGKDSANYAESNKTSVKDLLPAPVKLLIAGLPVVDKNYYPVLKDVDLGGAVFRTEEVVNYTKTLNRLNNLLAGSVSYSDMINKLASQKVKHPEYVSLINWLGSTPNQEILDTATEHTLELQKQFFRYFSKNKNIPMIAMIQESGEVSIADALDISLRGVILDKWKNNVKAFPKETFFKNQGGKLILDPNKGMKVGGALVKFKDIKQGQLNNWTDANLRKLLSKFGVGLKEFPNNEEISEEVIHSTASWLVGQLQGIIKTGAEITPDDIFSKSVVDINSKINALADEVTSELDDDIELSYFNQEGKREYVITLNTHISKETSALNHIAQAFARGEQMDESASLKAQKIIPYDLDKGTGNLFTRNSKWFKKLTENSKNPLRVSLLKGIKSLAAREGSETSKLDKHSMRYLHTNAILEGYFPLLRSADRSLEYAFKFNESESLTDYSRKEFIETMRGYLADELTTWAALKNEGIGDDLKNYSKKGNGLRFFEDIISKDLKEAFEAEIVKGKGKKLDPAVIADKFVADRKSEITSNIQSWLKDQKIKNLALLEESGLVFGYGKGNKDYIARGIKKESVEKIIGKGSREADSEGNLLLTKDDVLKISEVLTTRYTEGANEQLRLFLGDIAFYKSVADFHKRVTGAASTKEDLRLGQEFNDKLNEFYKRTDGKLHQDTFRKIVTKDVNIDSAYLEDIYESFKKNYDKATADKYIEAYKANNIEEADAQSRTTLDAYRELKLKGEEWTTEDEKTYQYEMQKFYVRAANTRSETFTEEKFQELFGEHLPEGTTIKNFKQAYYKGEVINEYKGLKPMPPLKLQGFGFIGNVYNLAATDFTKTSVAPLIPSAMPIGSPMFNHLMDMVENQIDIEIMNSGSKGDKFDGSQDYYNEDGRIYSIDEGMVQDHALVDFGFQQKIDTKVKTKATLSTQKESLEFVDLFQQGKMNKEVLPEEREKVQKLKDRKMAAKSSLIKLNRGNLLRKLGLEEDANGNFKLKKGSVEKLKKELKKAFTQRAMPDNVVDGIDLALDSKGQLMDTLANKSEIESVLMSLVRNNVIRQKVNGGMYVQEASTGLEPRIRKVGTSNHLKFYRPNKIQENGQLEDPSKPEGAILPAEIEIPVPKAWLPWVENLKRGTLTGLEALNDIIEKKDWTGHPELKELVEFASNRIPAQGINSMEAFVIKRFLPHHVGAKVVVPSEIVAKSGSDFDIDKLTMYMPAFYLKNGKPAMYSGLFAATAKATAERYYARIQSDIMDLLEEDTLLDEEGNIMDINNINNRYQEVYRNILAAHPAVQELTKEINNTTDTKREADLKRKRAEKVNEIHMDFAYMGTAGPYHKLIVSKMAKEFDLISAEEFEALPISEQLSKKELENEIMQISREVLLLKSNYHNLTRPIDADTLKGLADELGKPEEKSMTDALTWGYNLEVGENNWAGAAGVGMAAVQTTSHSYTQQSPVKIADPIVKLNFVTEQGDISNIQYEMGHTKDAGGNIISNTFGEFISAFVDVARDPFIKRINGGEAFNVYAFLQRVGGQQGEKPMSIRQAVYFLTQPIILDYLDARAKSKAFYIEGFEPQADIIDRVAAKYNVTKPAREMEWYLYRDYLKTKEPAILLKARQEFGYVPLSEEILHPDNRKNLRAQTQLQILDNFLTYEQYAKQLSNFNKVIKVDTGLPGTRAMIRSAKLDYKDLMEQGFWDPIDVNALFNSTILKEYKVSRDKATKMYNNFFLTDKHAEVFDNLFETILEPYKNSAQKVKDKVAQKVENTIIAHALHTQVQSETGNSLTQEYDSLIKSGPNSVAQRLKEVKSIVGDNLFLNELVPIFNEFEARRGRNINIDYVKLYSRKINTEESNTLTGSFLELIESTDPKVSQFAKDLVKLSIMQSGLENSPITFAKLIPNQYYQQYTNELITDYSNRIPQDEVSQMEFLEEIEDLFYENNWADSNIVPRAKGYMSTTGYKKPWVTKEGEYMHYGDGSSKYMVVNKTVKRSNSSKYKEVTGYTTKEEILFKRTLEKRTTKAGNEYTVYKPVSRKGHSYKFLEMSEGTSVLENNNKDYYEVDKITITPKEISEKVVEGDIFSLPGIPVITTNLGGVHGAGLAQTAKAKGLIQQKDGAYKATNKVVQLPVKKVWSDSMAMNNNMALLQSSLDNLEATAKSNPANTYLLPLAGLGHGEGSIQNILPLLIKTVQSSPNIKLVLPAENINLGRQGTVRKDKTRENLPKIKEMLEKEGLLKANTTSKSKSDMASFNNMTEKLSDATYEKLKNFFSAIGVEVNEVEEILDRDGKPIMGASGMARLATATVDILKGEKGLKQLPEEAAHFYIAMLGKDSNLYQKMKQDISNYPIYREVKEKYAEFYKNDETLIREEAMGQVMAEHIAAISEGRPVSDMYSDRQVKQMDTWWKALWAKMRKMFSKAVSDPYTQGALEVLENDLKSLEVKNAQEFMETEQDPTLGLNMEHTKDIAQIREEIKNKQETMIKNEQQLTSVQYDGTYSEFFPGFDALTKEEQNLFMEGVNEGDIEIVCKL
jgi:hypothetical protein